MEFMSYKPASIIAEEKRRCESR